MNCVIILLCFICDGAVNRLKFSPDNSICLKSKKKHTMFTEMENFAITISLEFDITIILLFHAKFCGCLNLKCT